MTLLHNKCQFARIFHWNVSGAIPVRPRSYTIADTHGCKNAGPHPNGNPGGSNTGRNRRCSGMCDRNHR